MKARGLVLSEAIPIRHEHGSSSLSLFTLKRQEIGASKAASGCSNAGQHRASPSHGHHLAAAPESNPHDATGEVQPRACTSVACAPDAWRALRDYLGASHIQRLCMVWKRASERDTR